MSFDSESNLFYLSWGENSSLHGFLHRNQGLMDAGNKSIRAELDNVLGFSGSVMTTF